MKEKKITSMQCIVALNAMREAESESLAGYRAQVYFNPAEGDIWVAHLQQNEHYEHEGDFIVLYAVDGWENKLKDTYGDENNDVDWDDKNYKLTPEYEEFERWYLYDYIDGFRVYDKLDSALLREDIVLAD